MTRSFAAGLSLAARTAHTDDGRQDVRASLTTPAAALNVLNVLLIGAPGAGKGTQAARLARTLGVPNVSTGDMLRRAVRAGTPLGAAVQAAMARGELVGDGLMTEIVAARLQEADTMQGFVLDGFPRTVEQAIALDAILEQRQGVLIAVELAVPDVAIIRRLGQRRVCERCGVNAEVTTGAARDGANGRCSQPMHCACGGSLRQRSDDTEQVVRERLRVYERSTRPLVDFYRQRRALRAIDGTQAPDLVAAQIVHAIDTVFDEAAG